ncbi:MAG: protein translocase subunit SecF [Candidatus Colwellbacteria bacterium]|nr:protein translocase subunit SecF [Candidatus Colwellbacteria bacterium]
MFIIRHKNYFYAFSLLLTLAGLVAFFLLPIRPSLEFTGGSLLEVQYASDSPAISQMKNSLASFSLLSLTIQPSEKGRFILRFQEVSEEKHQAVLAALKNAKEVRFETVGPLIGSELKQKSILALIVSVIATFFYILVAFHRVGGRIKPWKMSLATIIALVHDVFITASGFIIFAWWTGNEAGIAFVVAALTIWGYSIHDTVVVFDRFREKINRGPKGDLRVIAGTSINETIGRSINTSFAAFLLVVFLEIFGPTILQPFLVTLLIGIVIGTYSSICIAMPLLLERVGKG